MKYGYRKMLKIDEQFAPEDKDLDNLALSVTGSESFFPFNIINKIRHFLNNIASSVQKSITSIFTDSSNTADNFNQPKTIPSGYVYLGQFITHDISFDSKSDRHNPNHEPWNNALNIEEIFNKRKPKFNLEGIYGNSMPKLWIPETEVEIEVPRSELFRPGSQTILNLGMTKNDQGEVNYTSNVEFLNDLPRNSSNNDKTAKIAESRNDENLILAQMHVAFIKFHNRIVEKLNSSDDFKTFSKARKIAIRHYQQMILTDFLPRIIQPSILVDIKKQVISTDPNLKNKFYLPTATDFYLPIEFTVAAFRYGHSMIRDNYNFNILHSEFLGDGRNALHNDLFGFTGKGNAINSGTDFKLTSGWIINWNWFFEIEENLNDRSFNFSKNIDTELSSALNILLQNMSGDRINSLAAIDLFRGKKWELPTGQQVAEKMVPEDRRLTTDQILNKLKDPLTQEQKEYFSKNTPLIFYLLAEAEIQSDGLKLGEVGSRIVAEVMLKILHLSPFSVLRKPIINDEHFFGDRVTGKFGMKEMFRFLDNKDDINPIQEITH